VGQQIHHQHQHRDELLARRAGNLGECVEPLTAMVMDLTKPARAPRKVMYGARGWVAHHNTDLWRATAPIDGPQYGMWPMGGAWLCQNLWEHYLFTGDKKLSERNLSRP
jgi:alpha-L-fucosidase 2